VISSRKSQPPLINTSIIGKKSSSMTPFLMTFEILNMNVHNYLVGYGASSSVIPYSMCTKLNEEP
jgi:hypothetical protein